MVFITPEHEETIKEETFNLKDYPELKITSLKISDSESCWFEFLEDSLLESLSETIRKKGLIVEGKLKVSYDLSYCQGDYFHFSGIIKSSLLKAQVLLSGRMDYPDFSILEFKTSKGWDSEYDLNDKETKKALEELDFIKESYWDICSELKKEGYNIIESQNEETILNNAFKRFLSLNDIEPNSSDSIWDYDYKTKPEKGYIQISDSGDTNLKGLFIKPFKIKRIIKRITGINTESKIV